jgi:hypothetical protein
MPAPANQRENGITPGIRWSSQRILLRAADLPAVRWKQVNLEKLSPTGRERLIGQLADVLGVEE